MLLSPDEYLDLPRLSAVALSPDGTWIAAAQARLDAARARFVSDLWRVPVDGRAPNRLLSGDHHEHSPRFDDQGDLWFLSSRPLPGTPTVEARDDAPAQVWHLPVGSTEPIPRSQEPLGVSAFALAAGGRLLVLAPTLPDVPPETQRALLEDRKKNGPSLLRYRSLSVRHWRNWRGAMVSHLVLLDGARRTVLIAAPAASAVVDGQDPLHEAALHADGHFAVITVRQFPAAAADGIEDVALWRFDLAAGTRQVFRAGPRGSFAHPRVHPAGHIACTRHQREAGRLGPERLWWIPATAEAGGPTAGQPLLVGWDRAPVPAAWDGDDLLFTAQDQGDTALFRVSPEVALDTPPLRLTDTGTLEGISVAPGGLVAAIHHDLRTPPHPILLPADGGPLVALPIQAAPTLGVSAEEVWVRADDGTAIQGYILRPPPEVGQRRAALLWVHGGPVSQWGNGWHWRWCAALFAARGWVVALPNPRGSTGFGQDFIEGIWGNVWGDQCFRDLMAWTDHLEAQADVDPRRVVAMGGSFGGYMVNWFGGSTDRFAALVSHAGIFDHRSFYGVTDSPSWWRHQLGHSPHQAPEEAERYAPISRVSRWTTPVLISHGEKDYRCPVDQALALFTALQEQGTPSELLIFPDEGHWIEKPRNIAAWYSAIWAFLATYLSPAQG